VNWWDGQERRAWLDDTNASIGNALRYYLGPAAAPVNALAQGAAWMTPGADMMDMVQSGGDLMASGGGWDTAQALGGLGAATLGMIFPATAKVDDAVELALGGRAVFHSGTADAAEAIHKYGVEPQHGPWVQEVLAGATDDDAHAREIIENSPAAAWWADAPDWVEAKVRRATGRHEVTDDDIRQFGHLAIADPEDYATEMFRIGDEGLDNGPYSWVTDLSGERRRFYDTPLVDGQNYPFGIERNEIVTGEAVEPQFSLTGDELVEFMGKYRNPGGQNALSGIRAYHGSPHDFDRFDMGKIGTGEGAQAYGHGLYFAESEGVAKSYRDNLGTWRSIKDRLETDPLNRPLQGAQWLESGADTATLDKAYLALEPNSTQEMRDEWIRGAEAEWSEAQKSGKMYEVRINADPADFLDWDKPLSEQSEKVRGAAGDLRLEPDPSGKLAVMRGDEFRGYSGYARSLDELGGHLINSHVGEDRLREAGIPGIRYLDQGSRTAGDGSRNYVVFDDKLVEILRKYGLLGAIGGGAMAGNALRSDEERF
jgi:hypothetical protein